MPEVTGQVQAVSSKVLPSGTYHSFCVDDEWYRTGRTPTQVQKGYKVRFAFNDTKYGKEVDVDSLKFKEGEAPPANSKGKGGVGLSKDQYWANKEAKDVDTQQRISFQAATNTAIALVTAAITNGYIAFPKSAKTEAKFDAYKEIIMKEAEDLFKIYQEVPENAERYCASKDSVAETFPEIEEEAPVEEVEEDEWN